MSSQGPLSGVDFADNATVGSDTWTNVTNAAASDNSRASFTDNGGSGSHYLVATNFSFSVPASTINGVVVEIERSANTASGSSFIVDSSVKLVKGGTISGNDKFDGVTKWPLTASEAYATYGSSSDLWGLTLTTSDINASNFGVAIAGVGEKGDGGEIGSIDHIRITVHYTVGGNTYNETGSGGAVGGSSATVFKVISVTPTGGAVGGSRAIEHTCDSDALVCDKFFDATDTSIASHYPDFPGTASWTAQTGNWEISATNTLDAENTGKTIATIDPAQSDVVLTIDITFPVSGGNKAAGLVVRFTDVNNYFEISLNNLTQELQIIKTESGSSTTLYSVGLTSVSPGDTQTVTLELVGEQITFVLAERTASVWNSFNASETTVGVLSDVAAAVVTPANFDNLQIVPFNFDEDFVVRGGTLSGGIANFTYDETGSGGAVSGGIAPPEITVFPSGGARANSSATVNKFYLFTVTSSGARGGGNNTTLMEFNPVLRGGGTVGGSITIVQEFYSDIPTGGVVGDSTIEISSVSTFLVNGYGTLGNSTVLPFTKFVIPMDGGIAGSGTANVHKINNSASNAISGGLRAGSSSVPFFEFNPTPIGGSIGGGEGIRSLKVNENGSGGGVVNGTLTGLAITQHVGGGARCNGTASSFVNHAIKGGAKAGGRTIPSLSTVKTSSGGVTANGIARISYKITISISSVGALGGGHGLAGYGYVGGDRDDTVEYLNSITMGGEAIAPEFVGNISFNGHGGITISGTSVFVVAFSDYSATADTTPLVVSGIATFSAIYFNQTCALNPCTVIDKQSHNLRTHCDAQPRYVDAFDSNRRRLSRTSARSTALLPGIVTCRQKIFQGNFQQLLSIEERTKLKNRGLLV